MKIMKNASGKQIVKMSKKEWEDLGKKAGWMGDNSEIVREAQPVEAPVREKRPKVSPTEKPKETPRKRRDPKPGVSPLPKGKSSSKEEKEEKSSKGASDIVASKEVSSDNLPTIASELKKFKRR